MKYHIPPNLAPRSGTGNQNICNNDACYRKKEADGVVGKVHSIESFGTLDGPGIRTVIFLAGCFLRCKYCHNIDVVLTKNPAYYTPQELLERVLSNKPYLDASGGGVTVSGGDPFFQAHFLAEFFELCQQKGIHTAADTSLKTNRQMLELVEPHTDMFLVSLKHFDDATHRFLTGRGNKDILENIRYLSGLKKRIWFRYLILPGYTDTEENLNALIEFCKEVDFELIELLPYHTMGVAKWDDEKIDYGLKKVKTPSKKTVRMIQQRLESAGIKVLLNE